LPAHPPWKGTGQSCDRRSGPRRHGQALDHPLDGGRLQLCGL